MAEHKAIAEKYINPDRMICVVVGDATTQMKQLEKVGFGKPAFVVWYEATGNWR